MNVHPRDWLIVTNDDRYTFFEEVTRGYRRQRAGRVLIVEPETEMKRNDGTPEVSVEALMYELRERGLAALTNQSNQRSLAELSKGQVADVLKRLSKLKAKYPAITDDLLQLIGGCFNDRSF